MCCHGICVVMVRVVDWLCWFLIRKDCSRVLGVLYTVCCHQERGDLVSGGVRKLFRALSCIHRRDDRYTFIYTCTWLFGR